MYTSEQYAKARELFDRLAPADQAKVQPKLAEYEAGSLRPGEASGAAPVPRAELPPETAGASLPVGPQAKVSAAPDAATFDAAPPNLDTSHSYSLENASGLNALHAPPEYVAKNPNAGLKHILRATLTDPVSGVYNGPLANSYFEPTHEQFLADQGPVLAARGITKADHIRFSEAFEEYRDRKWQQAYKQAEADDRPLTRMEFVQNAKGWDKLKNALASSYDAAGAFVKGVKSTVTAHVSDAQVALGDAIFGTNNVDFDRAQSSRDRGARVGGEIAGAFVPGGALGGIAGKASSLGGKLFPGIAGRLVGGAIGGAAAGEADLATRSLAQLAGDEAHGRGAASARDSFIGGLLGAGLIGAGAGGLGQLAAEGATAFRKGLRSTSPLANDLGTAENEGGMATGLFRGISPSKDVSKAVEAGRFPLPLEDKAVPAGTAIQLQAAKVEGPIAAENLAAKADDIALAEKETQAALAADPKLHQPKPATNIANAAVDLVKSRALPEAQDLHLPLQGDAIAARNNTPFIDVAKKLWKPRIVTSVEAANEARATGGRVVSVAEAEAMGIKTGALKHEVNPETGIPHDDPMGQPGAAAGVPEAEWEWAPGEPSRPAIGPRSALARTDMLDRPQPEYTFTDGAKAAQAAGLPPSEFKVVLEPRPLNAQQLEAHIDSFDAAAKANKLHPDVDPAWKRFQAAIRQDREENFGPSWARLKESHGERAAARADRAGLAGIRGDSEFKDMSPGEKQSYSAGLVGYGAKGADINATKAIQSLAADASKRPGAADVLRELETLRATRAYLALKEKAAPKLQESANLDSVFTRVGGLGSAAKLRADALARMVERGPTGLPSRQAISPRLLEMIRQGAPAAREASASGPIAGMFAMGQGTLGMRAGAAYNAVTDKHEGASPTLTPAESKYLAQLLDAVEASKRQEAATQ